MAVTTKMYVYTSNHNFCFILVLCVRVCVCVCVCIMYAAKGTLSHHKAVRSRDYVLNTHRSIACIETRVTCIVCFSCTLYVFVVC